MRIIVQVASDSLPETRSWAPVSWALKRERSEKSGRDVLIEGQYLGYKGSQEDVIVDFGPPIGERTLPRRAVRRIILRPD